MKIVIPMTGLGSRFAKAGYQAIKPLIKVHGKPMIEFVISLFPTETNFLFICREEHLATTDLRQTLETLMPTGEIVPIGGHKLGPVYAVSQVFDRIDDEEQVIVNYCDFFMDWDYKDFLQTVNQTQCDGAIPSYTGFHPHLIPEKNLYASTKVDENNYMLEIREKHSFTENKFDTPHSVGTYYFKKGAYVKEYFQALMDQKVALNGEYYVSLVYNLLQANGLKTLVYDKIPHFCQWGTPQDLEEYLYWSSIFEKANF